MLFLWGPQPGEDEQFVSRELLAAVIANVLKGCVGHGCGECGGYRNPLVKHRYLMSNAQVPHVSLERSQRGKRGREAD